MAEGCKRRNSKFAEKRYMDRSADHGSQDSNFARYLGVSSQTYSRWYYHAFVQAPLSDPVWIHLPRGFHSPRGHATCLRLLKSLYGLSVAPRLWYQHLSEALREEGFKACANDPCLLYKDTIMVVLYVDDLGIAYRDQSDLDKLFANLEAKNLSFTREGTFTDFLGINFTRDATNGTLTLTQKGLIQKIKEATGMSNSNYNWTPAAQAARN
ncbi:transposable element-like protein [Fragilaria crotonensis]|nr:transposable element-like protein [Fragilaria crotonensis]